MISHEKYELTVMMIHLIMQIEEVKEYIDTEDVEVPEKILDILTSLDFTVKQYLKNDILSS